jgi:hypothetical protein
MTRAVPAILWVAAIGGVAGANGRPAATSTITFEQGAPAHVIAGATFGFLRSDDNGVTWKWMCEKAIGYGGTYDPDYAYSPTGAVFATTFGGLKVMRDGCTFTSAASGTTFVSGVEIGPTGDVVYAAADPADAKIYKSSNDGAAFPTSGAPGQNNDWWDSLLVAPSDKTRVYVTGYRFNKTCNATSANAGATCTADFNCGTNADATCEAVKQFLLFKSVDGGSSYSPMSLTGLTTSNLSAIDVVGIHHDHPDELYIRINLENGKVGDSIYKSRDSGATWHEILTTTDPLGLSFLIRHDGTLVAGTQSSGAMRSANGAGCLSEATCAWIPLLGAPHINCLVENPANHDVWACTRDFASTGVPGDGYGIMKSTDLASWSGVLRYQDIKGVVTCDASTIQASQCVASYEGKPSVWCCLEQQLGITDRSVACTGASKCESPVDAGVGNENPPTVGNHPAVAKPTGCCDLGGGGRGSLILALATAWLLGRRVRPR